MLILDGVQDGVVKLDKHASYVSMNKSAIETFGRLNRKPEEMIGNSVWEVFPELKGTIIEEAITKALREQIIIQYEVHFPPDGRWYETHGYATRDGVILIFRDITSRKIRPA